MTTNFLLGAWYFSTDFISSLNLCINLTKFIPYYLHVPEEQMEVQGC